MEMKTAMNCFLFIPILGVVIIVFTPMAHFRGLRLLVLYSAVTLYSLVSLYWVFVFDSRLGRVQLFFSYFFDTKLNLCWTLVMDGLSLPFVLLTVFVFVFCFLSIWKKVKKLKLYMCVLLFLEFAILGTFLTGDLLFFYLFFEMTLLPMFILIGVWGSGFKRIFASFYFFFYTAIGSVLFYTSVVLVYANLGGTNIIIFNHAHFNNVNLETFIFFGFLLSFLVKLPMFPFHAWLPEAHVQAPTEGSVILAALLLKIGGYGIIRILMSGFKNYMEWVFPLISTLCVCGVFYGALCAFVQIDLKKLIAYASVSHMNLTLVGIFSLNLYGVQGAIFMMISHGLVSAGFFFLIGFFYDRYHTRNLLYSGGLVNAMPIYSFFFFICCLANISMPLTCSFVGEFLIFAGIMEKNMFLGILLVFSSLLGVGYTFFMFNHFILMNLKQNFIVKYKDLTRIEFYTVVFFIVLIVFLGIFPAKILFISEFTVRQILLI